MSYDLDHVMKIGGFQGQIQEVAINFAPVQLRALKVILSYIKKYTCNLINVFKS